METKSRERISIDLQGLKPALLARSQAQGVSPSELVRKALEQALGVPIEAGEGVDLRPPPKRSGDRARLCLRMERDGAMAVLAAAKRSGLSPGDYVAGLVAGVPVLLNGGSRSEHIEALTARCSESRIDYMQLRTSQPLDEALSHYLGNRERLMRVR